jgi:hypothetical protein
MKWRFKFRRHFLGTSLPNGATIYKNVQMLPICVNCKNYRNFWIRLFNEEKADLICTELFFT